MANSFPVSAASMTASSMEPAKNGGGVNPPRLQYLSVNPRAKSPGLVLPGCIRGVLSGLLSATGEKASPRTSSE